MSDKPSLDAFHAHEVLHTASIIAALFEERIEQHAFTQADPEMKAAAAQIAEQLHEFYQLAGRKCVV